MPTSNRGKLLRRALALAVVLGLGLAVNLVVAWSITAFDLGNQMVPVTPTSTEQWPYPPPQPLPNGRPDLVKAYQSESLTKTLKIWHAFGAIGGPPMTAFVPHAMQVEEAGFPFRAVHLWRFVGNGSDPLLGETHGAIEVPDGKRTTVQLPVLPVWPGLALGTLFYAGLAWIVWRIPLMCRWCLRRERNQCPRCAYSLAGLTPGAVCPECGDGGGGGAAATK